MKKVIVYDEIKFHLDTSSGYYLSSTQLNGKREWLHRYIWIRHNSEIPPNYLVHHKDENKENNDISNLELVSEQNHKIHHGKRTRFKTEQEMLKFAKKGNEASKAWHKSEEGREWARKRAKDIFGNLPEILKVCECCGKEYTVRKNAADKSRFCSNKCSSKWRRDSGIDNEERQCVVCNTAFSINKYSKNITCGKSCAAKLRHLNKEES